MEVKDVCFVRHAKSSWHNPEIADYDRPLDGRGLNDAPLMAAKMKELGLVPDYIITSGAKRAHDTAEFFREEFGLRADQMDITDDLYEAGIESVFNVLQNAPEHARFIYVFGHNPTFTWVANSLSGVQIDNVPTCGIIHTQAIINSWRKFKPEHTGFIGFHFPKQYK